MKVIWTTDTMDHEGYLCVKSLVQLAPILTHPLEVLIFHKSEDPIEEISKAFLNSNVSKLYYINDSPSDDISALVMGKGGKVIDDEFFLTTTGMLDTLESDTTSSELALMEDFGDMSVIKGFQDRIKAGETTYPKKYMELVLNSAGQLSKDIQEANKKRQQTAEAGVRVLQKVARQFEGVKVAHARERATIMAALDDLSTPATEVVRQGSSSVFVFPEQKYQKTAKGLVVKEIGNVPFLTSFMFGLLDYSIRHQHKRAHLTIILPPGDNYKNMYPSDYGSGRVFIDSSNEIQKANYSRDVTVAFTNYPTVSVMNKLVTRDRNLNIILDRRQSSPKPFYLKSDKFQLDTYFAVQSESMFDAFKTSKNGMRKTNSFSSIQELAGTMFTIPMFEDYSKNKQQRIATYEQECASFYEKLIGG